MNDELYCLLLYALRARAPGSARPGVSARGEGAGPRGVSAGRDEKLVPDIYLTIPGCCDAPRPEVSTANCPRSMSRV